MARISNCALSAALVAAVLLASDDRGRAQTAAQAGPTREPILRFETGDHTARINDLAIDPAGRVVVTVSDDKTARVWSLSNAAPLHRKALFGEAARRTSLTRAFTGRLARSIHNEFIEKLRGREASLPPYPVQGWLTGRLREAALKAGRTDVVSLWSGQGAPLLRHRRAGELFDSLVV